MQPHTRIVQALWQASSINAALPLIACETAISRAWWWRR
jgi:hypothetical protein